MQNAPDHALPQSSNAAARVWLVFFISAFILYAATAHRGAQWQDSGWHQLRIVAGELVHPRGLALSHPLHFQAGRAALRILPGVEPAFAITLVSVLAAAIAVANVAAIVCCMTRSMVATLCAAAALALSHTFWQQATHTESYALTSALLTGEWLCLALFCTTGRGRFLLAMALFNGLGVSNHLLAALATPVDLVVLIWAWRRSSHSGRMLAGAIGLWLVGASLYGGLVLATMAKSGDVAGTLRSALVGEFAPQVLNTRLDARHIGLAVGYILYNFPGLTLLLAEIGLIRWRRTRSLVFTVLAIELAIYAAFVLRYSIIDQYTFFFPLYLILAILAGLGLNGILRDDPRKNRRLVLAAAIVTAFWTPIVYEATARILAARGLFASMVGNKPYRDGYRALFIPWGLGEDAEERLKLAVIGLAGRDGVILVVDRISAINLEYEKALGRLPANVELASIDESAPAASTEKSRVMLRRWLAQWRRVVLVPRDRDSPRTCVPWVSWTRRGDLYVLAGFAKSRADGLKKLD